MKTKQAIRQFLKPTKRKVLILIVLPIANFFFFFLIYPDFAFKFFKPYIPTIFWRIFTYYLFSCLLVFIWNKLKKRSHYYGKIFPIILFSIWALLLVYCWYSFNYVPVEYTENRQCPLELTGCFTKCRGTIGEETCRETSYLVGFPECKTCKIECYGYLDGGCGKSDPRFFFKSIGLDFF
jgi:hypothetical protein